jgi:hypothetical protein
MRATQLTPNIWNAIADLVRRESPKREVRTGRVIKRDEKKGHIWLEEFGQTAIPLVTFDLDFEYFDTTATEVKKRKLQASDAKIVVPRVGELVVVLDMMGNRRFPMCLGVIKSKSGYWQGEG